MMEKIYRLINKYALYSALIEKKELDEAQRRRVVEEILAIVSTTKKSYHCKHGSVIYCDDGDIVIRGHLV